MPATPDPDLAQRLARAVADVYGQGSTDLLEVVARRVARGIDSPGWAERKLVEVLALRGDAEAVLARLADDGGPAIAQAIREGASAGAGDAAADGFGAVGQLGAATHTRAVDALVDETVARVQSTHTQILRSTEDAYRSVIAETSAQTVAGTQTRRQAAQHALDRFADAGIRGFVDRAGRNWEIGTYAEMATRTAVGRAQVAGTLDRFVAAGRDLVIVSDHAQECELCRRWEGRILSISGDTQAGTRLSDGAEVAGTVRQAQADGLLHANCRHALTAYIPGLTRARAGQPDPKGDAARQQLRRLEHGERRWRRRQAVAIEPQAKRRADAKAEEWAAARRQQEPAQPQPAPPPPKPKRRPFKALALTLDKARELLTTAWDAWRRRLTTTQREAVRRYVGPEYVGINSRLRGINTTPDPDVDQWAAHLDAAFDQPGATLPNDLELYRSLRDSPYTEELHALHRSGQLLGSVIEDRAFMSTSLHKSGVLNSWAPVQLTIQARAGQKAIGPGGLAQMEREVEAVLPRGTRLRIVKASQRGNGPLRLVAEVVTDE